MNKMLLKMLSRVYRNEAGDDDGSGGGAIGTGNNDRVALLNSIGDNADRERGADFLDVNDDGTTAEFSAPAPLEIDPEEQADLDNQAAEQARLEAEQAAQQDQYQEPAKIIRKVNGQEVEITDDLITKAQKIAAADQYLAEASRLRAELAAQATKPAAQQNPVENDLASIARAIQMGTEEEAVAALRSLIPQSPSIDDFASKIDERLNFNTAYSQFCTEYKDIVSDPRLFKLAQEEDQRLTAAGDTRSYAERFTAIGEDLRKWKQPVAAPVNPMAEKEARKAAAPSTPKAAGGKHAAAVEEEKEESVSDTIARMAQSRGGPQWMNGASR